MKTIKLLDYTIIKEKKLYFWSGHTEGLYTSYTWKNNLCKINKIDDNGKIFIYDYLDNKEYEYDVKSLDEIEAVFKRWFFK